MKKFSKFLLPFLLLPVLASGQTPPTQTVTVNVAWTDNSNNETGFKILRCAGANCTAFSEIGKAAADATTYEDTISGDTGGNVFRYQVVAYNSAGDAAAALGEVTTPQIVTIPTPASGVLATVVGVKLE